MNLFKKNQRVNYKGVDCTIKGERYDVYTNKRYFYLYPVGMNDRYYVCNNPLEISVL